MPEVKCSVANCYYYGEGNVCTAEAIMVEVDKHANSHFNQEIGEIEINLEHQDHAKNREDTICHTFKPVE